MSPPLKTRHVRKKRTCSGLWRGQTSQFSVFTQSRKLKNCVFFFPCRALSTVGKGSRPNEGEYSGTDLEASPSCDPFFQSTAPPPLFQQKHATRTRKKRQTKKEQSHNKKTARPTPAKPKKRNNTKPKQNQSQDTTGPPTFPAKKKTKKFTTLFLRTVTITCIV